MSECEFIKFSLQVMSFVGTVPMTPLLPAYTRGEYVLHHFRHMDLVLVAVSLQEVDDDTKASRVNCGIIVVSVLVQDEQMQDQYQCLHSQ